MIMNKQKRKEFEEELQEYADVNEDSDIPVIEKQVKPKKTLK